MGLAQGKVASLFVEFRATVNSFAGDMAAISREVRAFDRILYPINQRVRDIGFGLTAGLTVPIVAIGATVLKTGTDFETAFAGVRKTVQASEEELSKLRAELLDLSTVIPITAVEFAKIAEVAGQLGIKTPDIARFTQTMAELGVATNLGATEAASFLARFTTITQLPQSQIHNLASTLTLLGNQFAASETEIANFALRIAGAGRIIGLTDAQILGFSAGLKQFGARAEGGGTAISRIFVDIDKAVKSGGDSLQNFAAVAGKSIDEFVELFENDAAEAVISFIEGLKKIEDTPGGNVFAVLDTLGLSNVRIREVLLGATFGIDDLRRSLSAASAEFKKNAELTREAGEKAKTTASQFQLLQNQITAISISLFDTFAPVINNTILPAMKKVVDEGIKPLVDAFNALPESTQIFIADMLLLLAAVGPVIVIITKLISFVGGMGLILGGIAPKILAFGGTIAAIGGELSAAAGLAVEMSLALGTFIAALKVPLAVPWWFKAGTYGLLVYELYKLARGYDDVNVAVEENSLALAGSDNAVFTAISQLKSRGIIIDMFGKSVEQLRTEVDRLGPFLLASNQASERMAGVQVKVAESTGKAAAMVDALAEEHRKIIDAFKEELAPATALNKELDFLLKHFSAADVIAVYADRIVSAAEAQRKHGLEVIGATAALYDQAKAVQTLAELLEEIAKEDVPTISFKVPTDLPGSPTDITVKAFANLDEAKKQIEELGKSINNLNGIGKNRILTLLGDDLETAAKNAKKFNLELDPVIANLILEQQAIEESINKFNEWEESVNEGVTTAKEMAMQIDTTAEAIRRMQAKNFDTAVIVGVLAKQLDEAAENAGILKVELEPLTQEMVNLRVATKESEEEAKRWEKIWSQITADIITDLSRGIAEAILHMKSLGSIFKEIASDLAKSFIQTMVAQLFEPLNKKFAEWGKALGKILKDSLTGANGPVAQIIAVVAAIGVAIGSAIRSFSNTHLFANKFVQEQQNPFGESLTEFVNGANALYEAGRQTYQGAQEAQAKVREMWQGFIKDAEEFGKQGRKQALVAAQGLATLEPIINRVIGDIQQQIDALKPPSVRVLESVASLNTYRAAVAANTEEYIANLREQQQAIDDQISYVQTQIQQYEYLGENTDELNRELGRLINQWNGLYDAIHPIIPEIYDFAEAVRAVSGTLAPDKTLEFVERVINATAGVANLEEALGVLEDIGTPVAVIVDRLGNDIDSFADALEMAGLPIPDLIAKYRNLSDESKKVSGEMPRIANSLSKLVGSAVEKLREIAGGGDLAQSILDALAKLLTGLPPATTFAAVPQPATTQVTINIEDNGTIMNTFTFTDEISRQVVRDTIIPEITESLTNNADSVKTKWIMILNSAWNGVVTK